MEYSRKKQSQHRALWAASSAITMAFSLSAFAQEPVEQSAYILRYAREVSRAGEVESRSKDIMAARKRVGDRSLLIFDAQNGVATREGADGMGLLPLVSTTGAEASYAFDYTNNIASGSDTAAANFNNFVHPLLKTSPAMGKDASWTTTADLAALGLDMAPASVSLNLTRTYIDGQDEPLALIEFDIPPFTYVLPDGETVVHWAHGFAVTDPRFGEIHALATQHRTSALAPDGTIRPGSVSTSLHGIDRTGEWRVQVGKAQDVQAAMARVLETRGEKFTPNGSAPQQASGALSIDDVASRLDFVAFGLMENSPNGIDLALSAAIDVATSETEKQSWEMIPPAETQTQTQPQGDTAGKKLSDATAGLSGLLERTDNAVTILERIPDLSNALAGADLEHPYSEEEYKLRLEIQQSSAETTGKNEMPPAMTIISKLVPLVRDMATEDKPRDFGGDNLTAAQLDALVTQMALASSDELNAAQQERAKAAALLTVSEMLREAGADNSVGPRLQKTDVAGSVTADWLLDGMNSVDDGDRRAQYEELMAELLGELELTRATLEKPRKSEGSGLDSLDDFVANNAFTFSSMVGIVSTDLARWAEWLTTQNVRELERLALTAGYPNLASALNDSDNILRQSQDEGYRQWALKAPSCGGYVGCGPSYLERWHMKTSIVALGDILNQSRDIFSTAGFNDVGIASLNLSYLLRDNATEDGDIVRVRISQFGRILYEGEISLTNAGDVFDLGLGRGVASVEIYAVNEGALSPNTAEIRIDDVVRGEATQGYSLLTGETATLRVEAGASASKSGAGQ